MIATMKEHVRKGKRDTAMFVATSNVVVAHMIKAPWRLSAVRITQLILMTIKFQCTQSQRLKQ